MNAPFQSSSARCLDVRRRPDLAISPQCYAHRRYWVLKDPVSLRYIRLSEQEYQIWQSLDGRRSLDQLKQEFEKRFAPTHLSHHQLQGFLADLHRKGLVLSDAWGQGEELAERDSRLRSRQQLQTLAGVLAIRFRGINPEGLLDWLYQLAWPLFSRAFLLLTLLLMLVAGSLVAVQFGTLASRLPQFESFFSATNMVWIGVTLATVKVLHELGHGLTCRHFGGRCHELGIMFLVFVPCLYCNVSDAWMLPNKWHRIAVTAAGVWVELTLAAMCTLAWWFSEPGILNTLCLNVMFVCSVSTILFNGNPLLRYDGYYILADWLEIPNLWQLSRDYLRSLTRRVCLGIRRHEDIAWSGVRRDLLALYAVASTGYRWMVLVGILMFLYGVLRPYRLDALAHLLLVVIVAGMFAVPVQQGWRFMSNLSNRRDVDRRRLFATILVLFAGAVGIGMIPLPRYVRCPLVVQPKDATQVYVSVGGRLQRIHVQYGQTVAQGDLLAELVNDDLKMEVARLKGELSTEQRRLENLTARRSVDPEAQSQLPTASRIVQDLEVQIEKLQNEADKLILRAPSAGHVLPPEPLKASDSADPGKLSTWQGTPLEPRNVGGSIEVGTTMCQLGDPLAVEGLLYIDQGEVEFVRKGQKVRLSLDTLPGEVIDGDVIELARQDAKVAPRELATGALPVEVDMEGVPRPVQATYQARVRLIDESRQLPLGSRGRAKIEVAWQTLAARIARYINRTFRFQL